MTKFITYYNLCPIPDPKEFLGIAADSSDDNIIATLGRNIVMVIKVSTQKQIRSWSVLEKFSTKVVYDRRSQKYVGVFAQRALRCWDEKTTDVNKCKKLKFQKRIADLVYAGETILLLYSDGTCEELSDAIQSRKEEVETSQQQIELASNRILKDAKITIVNENEQILTYFEHQNDTGELALVVVRSPLTGGTAVRFQLRRENLNVAVVGYEVIEGETTPMLLTIWSDKRIFLLNLLETAMPENSPGNFVSMITALKVDCPLSIIGISKHFVAIYGANSGQEGASLLLYNTQFKVIKAKQFFKVYFNCSRMWSINEHILLAMGQNLSVVSYGISKEVLADLVGTQTNNNFHTCIEGDHINEEEGLQESLQFVVDSTENVAQANEVQTAYNYKVSKADGKYTPLTSVQEFDATLSDLYKCQMLVEVTEVERALEEPQITLMPYYNDNGLTTREIQFITNQMERCGASECEITEKLLTILIKADSMQDILGCLRRYSSISEKMLAKALAYTLSKLVLPAKESHPILNGLAGQIELDNDLSGDKKSADSTINMYKNSSATELLNALLTCSFDSVSVITHLRRELTYTQVLLLLEHLYTQLTNYEAITDAINISYAPQCIGFELNILRWFGVLLNTHFQKLALSKEARLLDLLLKWHELFLLYKMEIGELEQVAAMLYNIMEQKTILKEKNHSKWYSIEEICLY